MSTNAPPDTARELQLALRELLGDGLASGDAAYAVDGLTPRFVATPASAEELAAALAAANERDAVVIPWGAGRHMALGNTPAQYNLALRTAKLDRVIEYEPTDLTVTVEAGLTMGRLRTLLTERDQFLPIDGPDEATIGGVLAAGASGPSRHAYGLPRDWLLGCRVAHADGSIAKGGGRVVKNVAGYDLPKLSVGSLGTLGVIIEATFKLAPQPAAQETLLATFPSSAAAAAAIAAADDRSLALRALALRSEVGEGALAAFWLAGPRSAVERTKQELTELTTGASRERLVGSSSESWWAALDDTDPEGGVALRASLPTAAVAGFADELTALAREADVPITSVSYPTTGLLVAQIDAAPTERLVQAIEAARRRTMKEGGSLVVTTAPLAVKERLDVWGDMGDALPLMRRLKEQFDPRGTINRGRYVGGL